MRKTSALANPCSNALLIDTKELQRRLNLGYDAATAIGRSANAKVCYGRLVRWNVQKIAAYLNAVATS